VAGGAGGIALVLSLKRAYAGERWDLGRGEMARVLRALVERSKKFVFYKFSEARGRGERERGDVCGGGVCGGAGHGYPGGEKISSRGIPPSAGRGSATCEHAAAAEPGERGAGDRYRRKGPFSAGRRLPAPVAVRLGVVALDECAVSFSAGRSDAGSAVDIDWIFCVPKIGAEIRSSPVRVGVLACVLIE